MMSRSVAAGSACSLVIGLFLLVAQIEALEFDLNRLNVSTTTTTTTTPPTITTTASNEAWKMKTAASLEASPTSGQLETSDAKPPPVYMSAPKQIRGLQEIRAMPASAGLQSQGAERESSHGLRYEKSGGSGAWPKRRATRAKKPKRKPLKRRPAKRHNGKRVVVVREGRKKRKKQLKKRIVVVKSKPKKRRVAHEHHHAARYREQHHDEPVEGRAGGAASSPASPSKYYEYRSVPSKGAWKFAFKRGNDKHAVQRKEHGHKSHFKTEVKWTDKQGRGHQLFDYNHADHAKGAHKGSYAAAGTKPVVAHQLRQVEAAPGRAEAGSGRDRKLKSSKKWTTARQTVGGP